MYCTRRSTSPPFPHLALALLLVAVCSTVAASPATGAAALEKGDLLVADANARVVWRVRASDRTVSMYAPRAQAQPSLLVGPAGIALDSSGRAYVADLSTNRVVEIDPTTGAQSFLSNCRFQCREIAIDGARFLEVVESQDSIEVYVASFEGLVRLRRRTERGAPLSWSKEVLAPGRGINGVGLIRGVSGVEQVWWVSTTASPATSTGVNAWDLTTGTSNPGLYEDDTLEIMDLEIRGSSAGNEAFLSRRGNCFPADPGNGVYQLFLGTTPVSTGGLITCPTGMATTPAVEPLEIYVSNLQDAALARVVRVTPATGGGYQQELYAEFENGAGPIGIAIAPVTVVPEPGAGAAGIVAAILLRALAHAVPCRAS